MANANGIELSLRELVELDHHLETGQLGLQNGLLDPLTIVHGRKDAMLVLDTFTGSVTPIEDSANKKAVWIIAYSGISRELTKSGFNQRVEECGHAAGMLKPGATNLSAVPLEEYDVRKKLLPTKLRLRAEHYFDEVDRVKQGAQAWANGDIETFGQLMNHSCRSSIRNYESGSPEIIELHEVASTIKGILGRRFSGGGYGGCVIALAEASRSEDAIGMSLKKSPEDSVPDEIRYFVPVTDWMETLEGDIVRIVTGFPAAVSPFHQ